MCVARNGSTPQTRLLTLTTHHRALYRFKMIATVATTRAFVAKTTAPVARRAVKAIRAAEEGTEAPAPVAQESAPVVESAEPVQSSVTAETIASTPSFGDLMAFSGPAPELINGRLSMVAVLAALGAELSSNESVLNQFSDASGAVLALVAITTVASMVPLLRGAKSESVGPFTPAVEMANGRAAMLGLAALLVIEGNLHHALF